MQLTEDQIRRIARQEGKKIVNGGGIVIGGGSGAGTAETAREAQHAKEADHAASADIADQANEAAHAANADEASHAESAANIDTGSSFWKKVLRKDSDDTASGVITFLKGIVAKAKSFFTGIVNTGNIDNSGDIVNSGDITTKNLTVTGLARFFKLVIDHIKSVGGAYISSPADGFEIDKVESIYDTVNDVHLFTSGGKFLPVGGGVLSTRDAASSDAVPVRYRLYWRATDGSKTRVNMWQVGDQALSMDFNKAREGTSTAVANNYWWSCVLAVSSEPVTVEIDGDMFACHYIEISNEGSDVDGVYTAAVNTQGWDAYNTQGAKMWDGAVNPSVGDAVAMLGHRFTSNADKDYSRQSAVYESCYASLDRGITPPLKAFYKGIDDFDLPSHRGTYSDAYGSKFVGRMEIVSNGSEPSPQPVPCDLGAWKEGMSYGYYDRVSYTDADGNTSLWLCVVKNGKTEQEPGKGNDWVKQVSGTKGDPGKDAIRYYIKAVPNVVHSNMDGKSYDDVIKISYVWQDNGVEKVLSDDSYKLQAYYNKVSADNKVYTPNPSTDCSFYPNSIAEKYIVVLYKNDIEVDRLTIPVLRDGDSGYTITANPSTLIMQQSSTPSGGGYPMLIDPIDEGSNTEVVIHVYRDGVEIPVANPSEGIVGISINTLSTNNCKVTRTIGDKTYQDRFWISDVDTYTVNEDGKDKNKFYQTGWVEATIKLGDAPIGKVRVPFACNLNGDFRQKIEGDVKTQVSEKVKTYVDENGFVTQETMNTAITQSASGIKTEVEKVKNSIDGLQADVSKIDQKADSITTSVKSLYTYSNLLYGGDVKGMARKLYAVYYGQTVSVKKGLTYTVTARMWLEEPLMDGHHISLYVFKPDWSWFTAKKFYNTAADTDRLVFTAEEDMDVLVGIYEQDENGDDPKSYGGAHVDWVRMDMGDHDTDDVLSSWTPAAKDVEARNLIPDPGFETEDWNTEGNDGSVRMPVGDVSFMSRYTDDFAAYGFNGVRMTRGYTEGGYSSDGLQYFLPFRGEGDYTLSAMIKGIADTGLYIEMHPCGQDKVRTRNGGNHIVFCGEEVENGYLPYQVTRHFDDRETNSGGVSVKTCWIEVRVYLHTNGDAVVSRLSLAKNPTAIHWNANELSDGIKREMAMESYIRQRADSIEMSVTDGVKKAAVKLGIKEDFSSFEATAGKFTFMNNKGDNVLELTEDGKLKTENIETTYLTAQQIAQPFEAYENLDGFMSGRSMSWVIEDSSWIQNAVFGIVESKNGVIYNIFNKTSESLKFQIPVINQNGNNSIMYVSLPAYTLFRGIVILRNIGGGNVAGLYPLVPYTVSGTTMTIKSFKV